MAFNATPIDKRLQVVFSLLLLVGVGLFIGSTSLAGKKSQEDMEPLRSYVAVYFEAETTPAGKMTINRWRTEYVKPNGE